MPVIAIFSGAFCHGQEISHRTAETLGYTLADDQSLVSEAAKRFDVPESKFTRLLAGKTSAFDKFTREKQRLLAFLKATLADRLTQDNLVLEGFIGLLIPRPITHVLRVLLIADMPSRITQAMASQNLSQKDALALIRKADEVATWWTKSLFDQGPWEAELYDLLIPVDKKPQPDAVALIVESAGKEVLKPTEASLRAVADFQLAAQVEIFLANKGHDVAVAAQDGRVTLTINKKVLMLSRLENELKRLVQNLPGVKEVETKVGPGYYQADIIYRQADLEAPSRVLLVDDEREFVQTLSERLLMRDVGSAVVYDGEEALSFVQDEEPDVMVLDLKMPGIDGIEVLRRVKREHPNIEVIILTGHGSKEDEETCLKLGAFAYLQKPVDIEVLSQTMRQAYRKIRQRKTASDQGG